MNVNSYSHQNNAQSFGMSLKLKGNAPKKVAEAIHAFGTSSVPQKREAAGIRWLEKFNKYKTEVTVDSDKVFVKNEKLGKNFEILDMAYHDSVCDDTVIGVNDLNLNRRDDVVLSYIKDKMFKRAEEDSSASGAILRKLRAALQCASDFDKKVAAQEKRLKDKAAFQATVDKLTQLFK